MIFIFVSKLFVLFVCLLFVCLFVLQVEESSSLCYLTQAVHSITQTVTLALQERDWVHEAQCSGSLSLSKKFYMLLYSIAAGASDEGITGDCQLLWWV